MDYFRNMSYMISHVFLMLFLYLFLTHRYSMRKTIGICLFSFMLLTVTDCVKLNIFSDSSVCYFLVTIFQILVTQFSGIFISGKRNSKALFLGLSASNYVIAGSVISTVLHIYMDSVILALIGGFLMHLVILAFLAVRIREIWLRSFERESTNNWWKLCMIPVLFYCSFSCMAFFPHTLYEYPDNIPGILLFIITMFVSYVIVMRYVESESVRSGIYWKNVMVEAYIKGLENHYYLVERSEQNLKILRHDMRHYSAMIDSLLEQGEYEEIRKVIKHINEVSDENKVVRYCQNLIVNTIFTKMVDQANSFAVIIYSDLIVEREISVNEYELASVVANLMENAISCVKELEQEKRYVNVKVHCNKEHLLIHIENEYEQEILFDASTGLPKSKKGGEHGLGMQSVLAFADKMGGNVGCYCENGIFKIVLFAKF